MNTQARLDDDRATFERLAWLLGALSLVMVPHALRMPAWITLLFAAMAVWRLLGARRGWGVAPAWLRVAAAILGVLAIGAEYRAYSGQDAGLAMVVVMMSLKLTETVSRRDCIVLVFIAYMLVVVNFLYSQSILTGIYMLTVVWIITATLMHLMHPTTGIPLAARSRAAGVLLLQALPVMLVLFFLFPRVPGPLWGVPSGQQVMTGLTDSMEPGSIAELGTSNAVAFRVNFDDFVPPNHQLYWRGPVLRNFDGRRWSMGVNLETDRLEYRAEGDPVYYEVTLEPHRYRWLFALDLPGEIPDNAHATHAWQLVAEDHLRERTRYRIHSYPEYATGPELNQFEVRRSSTLPGDGNPRARQLAAEWREDYDDPRDIIDAALQRFRRQEYWYTLSPPLLGDDAVDEFLFETREGFCEHYAGAFAFLMRAAGIPARVVLGYQGGELNPLGNYLIVRQSDAHAWVEVLLDDGWVRVDPTAAVAPDRIELGMEGLDELEGRGGETLRSVEWLHRMWLRWDNLNNQWNLFVLGYNHEGQRDFLARFGLEELNYRTLVVLLTVMLSALLGLLSAWLMWSHRSVVHDPAVRLFRKFERALQRSGVAPRAPGEGPRDYRNRAREVLAGQRETINAFFKAYLRYRYRPDGDAGDLDRMRQALKDISR